MLSNRLWQHLALRFAALLLACAVSGTSTSARATEAIANDPEPMNTDTPESSLPLARYFRGGRWILSTTAYTRHFYDNAAHNNHQNTIDLEHWMENGWIQGAAYLRNSFNQPVGYAYIGKVWHPTTEFPRLYLKLTGGVVYGYVGQYKNKIPFNRNGFAPAVLPSVGIAGKYFIGEVLLFGLNGISVNIGIFLK